MKLGAWGHLNTLSYQQIHVEKYPRFIRQKKGVFSIEKASYQEAFPTNSNKTKLQVFLLHAVYNGLVISHMHLREHWPRPVLKDHSYF